MYSLRLNKWWIRRFGEVLDGDLYEGNGNSYRECS